MHYKFELIKGIVKNLNFKIPRKKPEGEMSNQRKRKSRIALEKHTVYERDREIFTFQILDYVVQGDFYIGTLQEGDEVDIIICERDSINHIVAINLLETRHLILPRLSNQGILATYARLAKLNFFFILIPAHLTSILFYLIDERTFSIPFIRNMMLLIPFFALMLPNMLLDFLSHYESGMITTTVLRLLNFKKPEYINFDQHSLYWLTGDLDGQFIYRYGFEHYDSTSDAQK